jgi:hypothetical protein
METGNSETKTNLKSDEKFYVRGGGKQFTLPVTAEWVSEIALS